MCEKSKAEIGYEIAAKQVEYRRNKMWKIFSSTNTLLVALTGGIIALQTREEIRLSLSQKLILTMSVLSLAISSFAWQILNMYRQYQELNCMDKFEKGLGVHDLRSPIKRYSGLGYLFTSLLLAIATLAAIWLGSF